MTAEFAPEGSSATAELIRGKDSLASVVGRASRGGERSKGCPDGNTQC
jgi:hypothetical protein